MKENRFFPWVITLAALAVSGSAAYYSVYGIGKMFAGASTNVMIMAGSLEFSKLVIVSFLYGYWEEINKALRLYLFIACFLLICITSAGIYGFLSAAYQETANRMEVIDKKSEVISKESDMVKREIANYEKQIELKNSRLSSLTDIRGKQQSTMDALIAQDKSTASVRQQIKVIDDESKRIDNEIRIFSDSIMSKNTRLKDLDLKNLDITTIQDVAQDIGPLKYIAKLTGRTIDQVVNWFIIVLMLVFDPLAIALVIAANFLFTRVADKKTIKKGDNTNPTDIKEDRNTNQDDNIDGDNSENEKFTIGRSGIGGNFPIDSTEESADDNNTGIFESNNTENLEIQDNAIEENGNTINSDTESKQIDPVRKMGFKNINTIHTDDGIKIEFETHPSSPTKLH